MLSRLILKRLGLTNPVIEERDQDKGVRAQAVRLLIDSFTRPAEGAGFCNSQRASWAVNSPQDAVCRPPSLRLLGLNMCRSSEVQSARPTQHSSGWRFEYRWIGYFLVTVAVRKENNRASSSFGLMAAQAS
ncbi:MAG: hypothetical protein U0936_00055 [Planctomycetaceae bacterium]